MRTPVIRYRSLITLHLSVFIYLSVDLSVFLQWRSKDGVVNGRNYWSEHPRRLPPQGLQPSQLEDAHPPLLPLLVCPPARGDEAVDRREHLKYMYRFFVVIRIRCKSGM